MTAEKEDEFEKFGTLTEGQVGRALVRFVSGIETTETKIGEYSSRKLGTRPDLVFYGHQIYDLNSPTWLLADISTILDGKNKFKGAFNKTAFQLASGYCKQAGMDEAESKEIINKLTKLNKNKCLAVPIKPHATCSIDYEANGKAEKKKDANVSYIKWVTDKQTYQLKCTVAFEVDNGMNKSTVVMPITDYLDKFRLKQMDFQTKITKSNAHLLKMTDYGIIKPLVFKSRDTEIAVDGTYVYYKVGGLIQIIGYWDNQGKLVMNSSFKSQAIDKIVDNKVLIANHRKYIAPYLLYEANEIEL